MGRLLATTPTMPLASPDVVALSSLAAAAVVADAAAVAVVSWAYPTQAIAASASTAITRPGLNPIPLHLAGLIFPRSAPTRLASGKILFISPLVRPLVLDINLSCPAKCASEVSENEFPGKGEGAVPRE